MCVCFKWDVVACLVIAGAFRNKRLKQMREHFFMIFNFLSTIIVIELYNACELLTEQLLQKYDAIIKYDGWMVV